MNTTTTLTDYGTARLILVHDARGQLAWYRNFNCAEQAADYANEMCGKGYYAVTQRPLPEYP
jgi:hypothetical protein